MGKWTTFSSQPMITPGQLSDAISEILESYGDVVYTVTEEGLDKAEKVLIDNLKAATPKKTGKFAKAWKSKGKKYKLRRYIGNSTTVQGKSGEIALANIFEYSTTRGRPFIKETFQNSIEPMAQAIVNEIKKGV
jgi:formylmethanofuran dehydrogenase subunit E